MKYIPFIRIITFSIIGYIAFYNFYSCVGIQPSRNLNESNKQELLDKAIVEYTRAIGMNPNDSRAYTSRGSVYGMKGLYDKSLEDFTKVIELNPESPKAYLNRSVAYKIMGKTHLAKQDEEKSRMLMNNK